MTAARSAPFSLYHTFFTGPVFSNICCKLDSLTPSGIFSTLIDLSKRGLLGALACLL